METLLERLAKKNPPKQKKVIALIIKKGLVPVETTIIDKTGSEFDVELFKQRLRHLSVPKIETAAVQPILKKPVKKKNRKISK
tara:strand:+ start:746 stop:994 length:249 start_codon:yes stop_codon:yes gene_type:complete